jgi:hypothetical protein
MDKRVASLDGRIQLFVSSTTAPNDPRSPTGDGILELDGERQPT